MKYYGVTTVDNPFNPITDFNNWYVFDIQKGYGTCERLAALVPTSDSFSDQQQQEFISDAIDQMVKQGAFDRYNNFVELKKVIIEE